MLRLDISERLELRDSVVGNLRISGPGIRTGYYTGISGRKLVHGVSVVKIENKRICVCRQLQTRDKIVHGVDNFTKTACLSSIAKTK